MQLDYPPSLIWGVFSLSFGIRLLSKNVARRLDFTAPRGTRSKFKASPIWRPWSGMDHGSSFLVVVEILFPNDTFCTHILSL